MLWSVLVCLERCNIIYYYYYDVSFVTVLCHNSLLDLIVVGEPITVPKIENPTEAVVDLYHGMYLRSLQNLFDKYKTRFGLKESDVLHIQWEDKQLLLKTWTIPVAGLSLDWETVHLQTLAKGTSASTHTSKALAQENFPQQWLLTVVLAWTMWHHLLHWNLCLLHFFPPKEEIIFELGLNSTFWSY